MRNRISRGLAVISLSAAAIFSNASCFKPATGFGDISLFRPCKCECPINKEFYETIRKYTPEQVYAVLMSGGELSSTSPNSKPEVSYNSKK